MKKIILLLSILILVAGCGNKDLGFGNYEYKYVSCENTYIDNFKDIEISSWKGDGDFGLEVYTKDGNNYSLNSFKCYLSMKKSGE
ncbi:MAG: hypothetical protein RR766_08530 [Longicatena sp.]|jgi:hypothetical protein|uniref:lipoprotein n=1 Tax=Anaerorhabdus sp. TaxID=1872524 RepID=UPI002FC9EE71